MADFCVIQKPDLDLSSRRYQRPQYRDDFEKGYFHTRRTGARGRYTWSLGWSFMSLEKYNELIDFIDYYMGGSFTFLDIAPETSNGNTYAEYTVAFSDGTLPDEDFIGDYGVSWQGIQIEEK